MLIQFGSDLCPKSRDRGFNVDVDAEWCSSCIYEMESNDDYCACSYEETDEEQIMNEFKQIKKEWRQ